MKRPFRATDKLRNFSSGLPSQSLALFTRVSTCSILAIDLRVEGSCSTRGHDIVWSCWPWTDKCHWKLSCTCRLKLAVNVDCFVSSLQNTNSPETATCFVASIQPMSNNAINNQNTYTTEVHNHHSTFFHYLLGVTHMRTPLFEDNQVIQQLQPWKSLWVSLSEKRKNLSGWRLDRQKPHWVVYAQGKIPIFFVPHSSCSHSVWTFFPSGKRNNWRLKSQVRLRQYTHKGTWSTWS